MQLSPGRCSRNPRLTVAHVSEPPASLTGLAMCFSQLPTGLATKCSGLPFLLVGTPRFELGTPLHPMQVLRVRLLSSVWRRRLSSGVDAKPYYAACRPWGMSCRNPNRAGIKLERSRLACSSEESSFSQALMWVKRLTVRDPPPLGMFVSYEIRAARESP
jgi:hypothetical protein